MQLTKWVHEPIWISKVKVIYCPRSLTFNIFNFFSLETARPIKARFYVEPPWDLGTKIYINGLGHMTNVAAMPTNDKNL